MPEISPDGVLCISFADSRDEESKKLYVDRTLVQTFPSCFQPLAKLPGNIIDFQPTTSDNRHVLEAYFRYDLGVSRQVVPAQA